MNNIIRNMLKKLSLEELNELKDIIISDGDIIVEMLRRAKEKC